MKIQPKIKLAAIYAAARRDDNTGFCIACRNEVSNCEPDGRNLKCECCGQFKVIGAERLADWCINRGMQVIKS